MAKFRPPSEFTRAVRASIGERPFVDIEKSADFSPGHLSRILNGHQAFRIEYLYDILEAVGEQPANFFSRLCGPAHKSQADRQLRKELREFVQSEVQEQVAKIRS